MPILAIPRTSDVITHEALRHVPSLAFLKIFLQYM